uniref:Putative secreted peptide n=1 Tax=Rhipicephalus pulchellus TaxID=72859 RepID=L7MCE9_RHIPC
MAVSRTLAFALLATAAIWITRISGAFSQGVLPTGPGPALKECSGTCLFKDGIRSGCSENCTCSSQSYGLNVPLNYNGSGICVQSG